MKLVKVFTIENYPTLVQLTKSRKKLYFKEGDVIPKKYNKYKFYKGYLVDENNEKIIKNAKSFDKPRTMEINGQRLHELTMKAYHRAAIINNLKKLFCEYNSNNDIRCESIFVKFIFSNPDLKQDIDNHSMFYVKSFFDSIQKKIYAKDKKIVENPNWIINDDSINCVKGFAVFYKELTSKQLTIKIYEI